MMDKISFGLIEGVPKNFFVHGDPIIFLEELWDFFEKSQDLRESQPKEFEKEFLTLFLVRSKPFLKELLNFLQSGSMADAEVVIKKASNNGKNEEIIKQLSLELKLVLGRKTSVFYEPVKLNNKSTLKLLITFLQKCKKLRYLLTK